MSVIAELEWLDDDAGAVRVKLPGYDFLVVESDWVAAAGESSQVSTVDHPGSSFTTPATPGQWVTVFGPKSDRQEAYVCNNHSDPAAIVLVSGGPFPPKVLWPDSPPFFTSDWKGSISAMSPTHASVRCSRSQV